MIVPEWIVGPDLPNDPGDLEAVLGRVVEGLDPKGLRGEIDAMTGKLGSGAAHAARVAPVGIDPALVYVTDVDGFELATQSVGVVGDDGMSASYMRFEAGRTGSVLLTTGRTAAAPDAASDVACADLPDASATVLRCVVEIGDVRVLLEGEDVDAATLREAAAGVRVPRADELDTLFEELPTPGPPVERGDLPPEGDGAPMDPPGVGG